MYFIPAKYQRRNVIKALFVLHPISLRTPMLRYTATIYRNAYSGLSKGTWLLSIIMLINRSGTMVVPFMTLYLTSPEMGYSVAQAGIVFAFTWAHQVHLQADIALARNQGRTSWMDCSFEIV